MPAKGTVVTPVPPPGSPRSTLDALVDSERTGDDEPGLTDRMNEAVDAGVADFNALRTKLRALIGALKVQHASMIEYSGSRLEAAKQLEAFTVGTPLAKVVGGESSAYASEAPNKTEAPDAVARKITPPFLPTVGDEGGASGAEKTSTDSNVPSAIPEEQPKLDDDESEDGNTAETELLSPSGDTEYAGEDAKGKEHSLHASSSKSEDASDDAGAQEEEEEQDIEAAKEVHDDNEQPTELVEEGISQGTEEEEEEAEPPAIPPVETAEVRGSYGAPVDTSNTGVHLAAYELNKEHAAQFERIIIQYAESWLKVVSSRIDGRRIEFNKLRESLSHYIGKVEQLREGVEKLRSHNKAVSPKKAEKLERNELKLSGAQEAHHSYGESLLVLMDEVNVRAWRDVYPIIVRMLQLDMNHSTDEAELYGRLAESAAALEAIGKEWNLERGGRLRSLKESHPEEIYTGSKHMLHPVLSTRNNKSSEA